ncbi:MAG: hypothetical protein H7Y37_20525 [Anaerolineae bacterium]|nr:hypothetical protein [Gloeobacterales cyanobacterium ES-bin-313]
MQYLQEGLSAYKAQQYSEALLYFQQALPHIESPTEKERVLMWIACSSLAIGNYDTLLSVCPSLLGSEDIQVRRFARSVLKQYGLIGLPQKSPDISILKSATEQYFEHFWALQRFNFHALFWLVGLGILLFAWCSFGLNRPSPAMPTWNLHNAQQFWWEVLMYLPPGIALLIGVDRCRSAVQSQKMILQNHVVTSNQGKAQAISALFLTVGLFGLLSWWQWPVGCLLGLCLEPWWVCILLGIWAKK